MKKLVIIGAMLFACLLGAQTVRVYYTVGISTRPDTCAVSLKTGPAAVWDSVGTSPCVIDLYRDFNIMEFIRSKPVWGKAAVFYSPHYGAERTWDSEQELFEQLRRDYGDLLIRDLGIVSLGWIKAEKPDHDPAVKAINLNGNISSLSFDQATASASPNRINFGLKPHFDDGTLFLESSGTVTISSEPVNAAVYCSDEYLGQTPCVIDVTWHTPESKLELRFEKPGYATETYSAGTGESNVHVVLKQAIPQGRK